MLMPPTQKPKNTVELVIGGDIMLSRGIGRWAKNQGYDRIFTGENFHPLHQFSCFKKGECLLVFNLESPFSEKDNDQAQWWFRFRSNPANIQTLLDLKEDNQLLLSLANNHTNNAWGAGIQLTRALLDQHKIHHIGAGENTQEARMIKKITKNWINLCFWAYSYDGNSNYYGGIPLARNPLQKEIILEDLQIMQQHSCDTKILMLHRGAEYRIDPNKTQTQLAHTLIENGADIILGGHSHIPGKIEFYQGKPIFYSFGNFIFDQDRGKKATSRDFDYTYDYELNRKTVATYIPLLAQITLIKKQTWIHISSPILKMARINKGIFSPLDEQTLSGILSTLQK